MNKFSKYFAAFASLAVLASCSNDEPNAPVNPTPEGELSYLAITLRDANDLSRAEGDPITNGDYEYSQGNEGTVDKARFFFFDDKGIYAGQTTSDKLSQNGDEKYNIEFKAKSVIVLNNIVTDGEAPKYPTYMVTLINVPQTKYTNESLKNMTLAKFSEDLAMTWGSNSENGFVMATTSYYGDEGTEASPTGHSNTYYYANVLKPSDFANSPETAINKPAINVYVERLAARVEVSTPNGQTTFPVKATAFGATGDNPTEGATEFTVRVDGWYLNGIQPQSHLLKQLDSSWANLTGNLDWNENSLLVGTKDAPNTPATPWQWNKATDFRSFWGKGVNYGSISDLTFFTYDVKENAPENLPNPYIRTIGQKDYCNENTTHLDDLKADGASTLEGPNQTKVTSVIIKATVLDKDGKVAQDLVEHNGVYFTNARFIDYVLSTLNTNTPSQLNFYTCDVNPSEIVAGKEDEHYKQVDGKFFTIAGDNEHVYVAPDETKIAVGKIYKKTGEKQYVPVEDADITALKNNAKAVNANASTTGFKDGKMYYNIPIAHLNSPKYETTTITEGGATITVNNKLTSWETGSFGVVRNHAYKININTIRHLGTGVFDPTGEVIKPKPDPKKEYWWLGATINILSWKIVNNSVDL